MICDMNFIYFICPEVPQISKYCEGFYNYLTYGYKTWTRDTWVSSTPKEKDGRSRILKSKSAPIAEEMKANDFVFDRIHRKVITTDCYTHNYSQITDKDISGSSKVYFITSNSKPVTIPNYLYSSTNHVICWKMSNINNITDGKYELLESLIRRIAKPNQS